MEQAISSRASQPKSCDCGDPDCPGNVTYAWPFKINFEYLGDGAENLFGYFSVRTSSAEWAGERTDLHDLLSLLWAMLLRARDVASVQLISELNAFSGIDSEIYARILVTRQEGSISVLRGRTYFEALSAESYKAHDMILAVFGTAAHGPSDHRDAGADYRNPPDWVAAVRKRLRLPSTGGWEFNHRRAFDSKVFTCLKRDVTVAELGAKPMKLLRELLSGFRPNIVDGVESRAFRTGHLVNAVPLKKLQAATSLLGLVEKSSGSEFIVPTDSHFMVLGKTAFVAIASPGGVEAFDSERIATESRREAESDVFLQDAEVVWNDSLNDVRFEALVGELLSREPGMHWLRQVGATREPDDGRDFIAEWSVPPVGISVGGVTDGMAPLYERRHVMIQVKLRSRGVSRTDMPGLRDTLEHYQCSGLLVVAFPQVTTTLFDHLNELRRRGQFWVDWWGRTEIERRLRRYPEIAMMFHDLVTVRRPSRPA